MCRGQVGARAGGGEGGDGGGQLTVTVMIMWGTVGHLAIAQVGGLDVHFGQPGGIRFGDDHRPGVEA